MDSNNAPQSFKPRGMSGLDPDHLQPTSPPPSQGDMGYGLGNSNNKFQGLTGYRGLTQSQPNVIVEDNKAPSLTDMGHAGQGNSYNYDPNKSSGLSGNSLGYNGQPPSHGDIRAGTASQTSDGHVGSYSKDGKAPGISDVAPRDSSETGGLESVKMDGPDAQEFVGISLVGKNFRKFYPNAYYREQDEENQ